MTDDAVYIVEFPSQNSLVLFVIADSSRKLNGIISSIKTGKANGKKVNAGLSIKDNVMGNRIGIIARNTPSET